MIIGELITRWTLERGLAVQDIHPGISVAIDDPTFDPVVDEIRFKHSSYSVSTAQDHKRIGKGVNWCVCEFQVDEATFLALDADSDFLVLMRKGKDEIPAGKEINKTRQFLVSLGVSSSKAAEIAASGLTRFGITKNIKNIAAIL